MPTARRIATPRKRPTTAQSMPAPISPSRKAGITTWSVAQPSTHASATVRTANRTLPRVESVKMAGSRRMPTARTRNPAPVVPRRSRVPVGEAI